MAALAAIRKQRV